MMNIMVLLKDGGYKVVKIEYGMVGDLAKSIHKNGVETLRMVGEIIQVVGFVVTGKHTGERVIMLGFKEAEQVEVNV